jgi:hypothetical protein
MTGVTTAIKDVFENFEWGSELVRPTRWQGQDVSKMNAALMKEDLHVSMQFDMAGEALNFYALAIVPNLPWADNHFLERVCGYPINPGIEWANWSHGVNAEKSLNARGMFNHNYMERYWPKYAGESSCLATRNPEEWEIRMDSGYVPTHGIRHDYGDLGGLVRDLAGEPDTRQAYLPVWFPEDTGDAHKGRKPCTLGYHFIMRRGQLDVTYYLRSCDLANHFRDDVYLTVRLLLWVLDECRKLNPEVWNGVVPGKFTMHITSLHMFINDYRQLYGDEE